MRAKISAFVISYNRAALLESCLRAVSFADELIVVDKSSTDGSAAVAARHADRVEIVPWSPTVEDTRAFALSLCRHDWILFLDDDEILSSESGTVLRQEIDRADIDIFAIPLRHYILGVHDERACYWPEAHHRLFRKGAISFIPTVHGGSVFHSGRIDLVPVESGVCIHHLSHPDVASFIERTNRYTGRADRARADGGTCGLADFARERVEYWLSRNPGGLASEYCDAVALLRAIYEIVDRLKTWEEARGLDGAELFRIAQRELAAATDRDGGTHAAGAWVRSS
jgi:glycosyltransferase involved in cell wall biosynthesis